MAGGTLHRDPLIADQFISWLEAQGTTPWCTTVSFVNPHDIGWYDRGTEDVPAYANLPRVATTLPPNFETPADLRRRNKPRWQSVLQELWPRAGIGELAFDGPGFETKWIKMRDVYLQMQRKLDIQIGRVLDALAAHPAAGRTIVLFTADHGEYAGSHGLRGKGFAVYDEALRVPLVIRDPTGRFTAQPEVERQQLTSSVDILPLLLTLASGGTGWRALPQYAHLANRLDLATLLHDSAAPGRPYILHTCDEDMGGVLTTPLALQGAPSHVIGLRTANAKLGTYSHWTPGSLAIETAGQELECYDYRTPGGRLELGNVADTNPVLRDALYAALIDHGIPNELRKPLPDDLQAAQQAGIAAYLTVQNAGRQLTCTAFVLLFDSQPVGTGSPQLTTTLTNSGATPLTIHSASITGPQADAFVLTGGYTGSLAPGASCTISVTFLPRLVGRCYAQLNVAYDLTESPAGVLLQGSGTPNLPAPFQTFIPFLGNR